MTKPILSILQRGGLNHIRVLAPLADGKQQLLWQTNLAGSEHQVLLAEWLNDDEFIVADESGNIFQAQLSSEQCRKVQQLPGAANINAGCYLDKATQQFWYATDFERGASSFATEARLLGWSLPDWQPIANILLPRYISCQTLLRRSDGCFLFYRQGRFTKKDRPQGFYCCQPSTAVTDFHPIASPSIPLGMYAHKVMTFNTQHDLLLMPCMPQPVESDTSLLNYQLQLISLRDFSILWQQSVPQLDNKQAYCEASELKMIRNYVKGEELANGIDRDDVEDALDNFIEQLCGVKISDDGQSVWLEWADAVQKLSLDPQQQYTITQSQRFLFKQDPPHFKQRPTPLTTLSYPLDAHILTEREDGSLLIVGMEYTQLDIANARATNQADCFEISCRTCAQPQVIAKKKQKKALAQMDKLVIRLQQFNDQAELLNAGQVLVEKLHQLPDSASGSMLELMLIDRNEQQMTELAFARKLLTVEGGATLLVQALEVFCNYPAAAQLRSGASKSALADVVRALAEHNIKYLPKLVNYFHSIDAEHCAHYHIEHCLQFVYDNYNHDETVPQYLEFMHALPWPFNFTQEQ